MHPKFDLKLMFQGGRRCLFGVPGVCQTSDRHHHLDKGRKSSFMISCHHCCQRTSSLFTFIFITGKRNRKPESVDWRGSLSNKSCSQERFPVDFQTHKHLSQSNSIMSVDDPTCHWKWFIIITVNLQPGSTVENMDARLAIPKAKDFRGLLHWQYNVSFNYACFI